MPHFVSTWDARRSWRELTAPTFGSRGGTTVASANRRSTQQENDRRRTSGERTAPPTRGEWLCGAFLNLVDAPRCLGRRLLRKRLNFHPETRSGRLPGPRQESTVLGCRLRLELHRSSRLRPVFWRRKRSSCRLGTTAASPLPWEDRCVEPAASHLLGCPQEWLR